MGEKRVGVLGASGLTGSHLLEQLVAAGWQVSALSRQRRPPDDQQSQIRWFQTGVDTLPAQDAWIVTVPMWELPDDLDWIAATGAKHIVALSSTSRFSKPHSRDAAEQDLAARLIAGEQRLQG